jgi:Mitochondrial domain of unknown function (DUF1713)
VSARYGAAPARRYPLALAYALPPGAAGADVSIPVSAKSSKGGPVGSVIKKRRKRMAKKKHRKLLRKTRVQRRNKK